MSDTYKIASIDKLSNAIMVKNSMVGVVMQQNIVEPLYGESNFNCPKCFAYAHHRWYQIMEDFHDISLSSGVVKAPEETIGVNGFYTNNYAALSICASCEEMSYWRKGKLVHPIKSMAPLPNEDMPEDVQEIYNEAREVSALSPRAATALLRLALEKLLPQVGATKSSIDKMIGELVGKGLPKEVEKALDSLQVIGNEAVHPGTIDLGDNDRVAHALFKIMNMVVDRMITQQKEIDEIYSLIPESKLEGIEKRNQKALNR